VGNLMWLPLALPRWYIDGATHPFAAGALTLLPAVGMVSLVLGVVLGALSRRSGLLWFVSLFVLSEALVAAAGLMRGQAPLGGSTLLNVGLWTFLGVQLAVSGYLIYRTKGARLSAAALGLHSVAYAATASFVAAMSFTDTWL